MWHKAILLGSLGALMACGTPAPIVGTDGTIDVDACDARSQRGLVGRELDDMAAVSAAAPKVRFINPGDSVTQDNQPDRLNVELDDNRVVTRVYCG
ncbi:I78 family peptidase inhibitor [Oceanibium sediminis]|uniref:I78 family peptidase inhibitor n=1 Tax=Oceanibium sediminis TaxID=2026339 RepID=UPI000DD40ECB|nr:I78 family peptidase inhibitor [Oceanibium sediminis]